MSGDGVDRRPRLHHLRFVRILLYQRMSFGSLQEPARIGKSRLESVRRIRSGEWVGEESLKRARRPSAWRRELFSVGHGFVLRFPAAGWTHDAVVEGRLFFA